jgi:hypothetical protein
LKAKEGEKVDEEMKEDRSRSLFIQLNKKANED